jgi:hypothetical protein
MDQRIGLPPSQFIIGVDIAQGGADFCALVVLEQALPAGGAPCRYALRHLERWRSERSRRVVDRVDAVMTEIRRFAAQRPPDPPVWRAPAPLEPMIRLAVDITGVGPFALDPLRERGLAPTGLVITGGHAVTRPAFDRWTVPKQDLVGLIGVLLEHDRLVIPAQLPVAATLVAELKNFHRSFSATGRERFAAGDGDPLWREGEHDDLVLALALAAWLGERDATHASASVISWLGKAVDDEAAVSPDERWWRERRRAYRTSDNVSLIRRISRDMLRDAAGPAPAKIVPPERRAT